jgi:hypothetical protein
MLAMGPEEIRAATATVPPVTDNWPSLEFHRFRHPLQEYRGPFNLEQARTMHVIYQQRARLEAPLMGALPGQAEDIAAWRKLASQQGLADVRRYWGIAN